MGVKLVSSSGGSVELVAPTTASNYTATMPANTGTVITTASTFAGTGPAFSAYPSTNQSISALTWTKVTLDVEAFDTNSNFASSRFTPTVAGYYQISALVYIQSGTAFNGYAQIYKNGAGVKYGSAGITGAGFASMLIGVTCLLYMNGSTDYLELYAYSGSASTIMPGGGGTAFFEGFLARAA